MTISAFGKILVCGNAFFYLNSNEKSIDKLIFSAFGKILVCGNAFFYLNSKKKLKNWVFQLLARSWFAESVFSMQTLIKKVLKNWFFQVYCFFAWSNWWICFARKVSSIIRKNIFYVYWIFYVCVFPSILQCFEDSGILNSIF